MKSKLEIGNQGIKIWYNENNRLHREDGPALEDPAFGKIWYFDGHFHREDGPAVEHVDGYKAWYYHGKRVDCFSQEEFERMIELLPFEWKIIWKAN